MGLFIWKQLKFALSSCWSCRQFSTGFGAGGTAGCRGWWEHSSSPALRTGACAPWAATAGGRLCSPYFLLLPCRAASTIVRCGNKGEREKGLKSKALVWLAFKPFAERHHACLKTHMWSVWFSSPVKFRQKSVLPLILLLSWSVFQFSYASLGIMGFVYCIKRNWHLSIHWLS